MSLAVEERVEIEEWLDDEIPCRMADGNTAEWRLTLRCGGTHSVMICTKCHDGIVNAKTAVSFGDCHYHRWSDVPRLIDLSSL